MGYKKNRMGRLITAFIVTGFFSAYPGALYTVPGKTMATQTIQNEAENNILLYDYSMNDSPCQIRKIVNTEILETQKGLTPGLEKSGSRAWKERWYLDRCGKIILYEITYTPDEKGGTIFFFKEAEKTEFARDLEPEDANRVTKSKEFTRKIAGSTDLAIKDKDQIYPGFVVSPKPGEYRIASGGFAEIYQRFLFEADIHRIYNNARGILMSLRTGFGAGINQDTAMAFTSYHFESGFNSVIPSIAPAAYGFYTGRDPGSPGFQISLGYTTYSGSAGGFGYFAGAGYEFISQKKLGIGAGVFGDYLFAQVPQNGTFHMFELRIPAYASLKF